MDQSPLPPPGEAAEGPSADHVPRGRRAQERRLTARRPPHQEGDPPRPGSRQGRKEIDGWLFLALVPSGKSLKVTPEPPAEGGPNQHNVPAPCARRSPGQERDCRLFSPFQGPLFADVQSPASLPLFRGVLRTHPNLPSSTEAPSMSEPPRPRGVTSAQVARQGAPPPRVPVGPGGEREPELAHRSAGPQPRLRGGPGAQHPRGVRAHSSSAGRSLRPAPGPRRGRTW